METHVPEGRISWVALDAMGVIYEQRGVSALLAAFAGRLGVPLDPDVAKGVYREASLGGLSSAELWEALGGERLWRSPWPVADERFLARETFTLVVQVNGKVRDRVEAPTGASREELEALAREQPNMRSHLDGKDVVKVIVVPDKLVNIVVR